MTSPRTGMPLATTARPQERAAPATSLRATRNWAPSSARSAEGAVRAPAWKRVSSWATSRTPRAASSTSAARGVTWRVSGSTTRYSSSIPISGTMPTPRRKSGGTSARVVPACRLPESLHHYWTVTSGGRAGGQGPVAVPVRPVPPLGRVVDQPGGLQGGGEDLAVGAGLAGDVRRGGVAGAAALLGVVVDLGAHVVLDAVGVAEGAVDGGACGVRGDLDRGDVAAGGDVRLLLAHVGEGGAQAVAVLLEVAALGGDGPVALDDQQVVAVGQVPLGPLQPGQQPGPQVGVGAFGVGEASVDPEPAADVGQGLAVVLHRDRRHAGIRDEHDVTRWLPHGQ